MVSDYLTEMYIWNQDYYNNYYNSSHII